uniref:Interferon-induced GTP-binding protein Mx3-like n=1 Tax=Sinocyclocheilus rhinocerous TaxID=307959 RepID=A0A673G254_9TELE
DIDSLWSCFGNFSIQSVIFFSLHVYIFLYSQKMRGEVHSHLEESIRPYIDLIDTLRSVGIHKDLALPTIVVIGDQSSGKSSVLEALSGVALPRGNGIVTRCPLELRLKKVPGVNWKAVLTYDKKKIEFSDPSLVEEHVAAAQNELAGKGVGIRDELITLEVMSPDVCDLTLIDLPGIARVPVEGQPEDIGKQIKRLIMKYIKKHETINLVVVPCNTDIATTEALKMAQEVDPEGIRTVAILTKPDLIDKGTEKTVLAIVHNKVIPLRKGYIMVKCRGQQQINDDIPLEEAAQMERDFFQNHDYFRCLLKEDNATIKSLAVKLTQDLVDHIEKSLPQLQEQIKKQLWSVKKALKDCEDGPPEDLEGAKEFLIKTLNGFNEEIKSLSSGEPMTEKNMFAQLRAEFKKWNDYLNSTKTSCEYIFTFKNENYRGMELPGFMNYRMFQKILLSGHCGDECFQNYHVLQNTTKDKINNIQLTQLEKAEQRISEQFKMENRIYTQDPIFLKILSEITNETFSEKELPIVVQRMADQLPLMITFYMLQETAQLLTIDTMKLLEKPDVHELLSEDSDVSKRRKDLRARLNRLTSATKAISIFFND